MKKTTAGERAFQAQPEQIAKRSSRNQAHAIMEKKLGKAAVQGKQIDHKDGNALNNSPSNLRAIPPKINNVGRRGGKAKDVR